MIEWQNIAWAVGIVGTAVFLSWLSRFGLSWLVHRFVRQTETHLDDALIGAVKAPLRFGILVVGLELGLERLDLLRGVWVGRADQIFFVIYALLWFLFLFKLITGLVRWYEAEIVQKTETMLDDQFLDLFKRIGLMVLTAVFIVIVLGRFGVEISALVTTLGIGSLAVALAAQETLENMFAGFSILVDQPFKVGDRVELLDLETWGDVQDIGLRSTRIRTRDNRMVTVPNAVIGKGLVVNYSDPDTVYRVETTVGVAYGTDIEQARQVMIEAIRAEPWVMTEQRIEALFLEFGDSSLNFRVRCWIEHYVETRRIIDKMNTALYRALNEANIEIPFPQRDLHLVSSRLNSDSNQVG